MFPNTFLYIFKSFDFKQEANLLLSTKNPFLQLKMIQIYIYLEIVRKKKSKDLYKKHVMQILSFIEVIFVYSQVTVYTLLLCFLEKYISSTSVYLFDFYLLKEGKMFKQIRSRDLHTLKELQEVLGFLCNTLLPCAFSL